MSISRVRLFATPWTAARQASLSFPVSLPGLRRNHTCRQPACWESSFQNRATRNFCREATQHVILRWACSRRVISSSGFLPCRLLAIINDSLQFFPPQWLTFKIEIDLLPWVAWGVAGAQLHLQGPVSPVWVTVPTWPPPPQSRGGTCGRAPGMGKLSAVAVLVLRCFYGCAPPQCLWSLGLRRCWGLRGTSWGPWGVM